KSSSQICCAQLRRFVFAQISFFFSSRRRHTRSKRDWSSDVCSSDLGISHVVLPAITLGTSLAAEITRLTRSSMLDILNNDYIKRSEERRVGKECRSQENQRRYKET